EKLRQQACDLAGEKLMPCHAARLTLAKRTGRNDEVVNPGADRRHQRTDGGRIVGAVAVHEDDDVGGASSLSAFQTSKPVAAPDADDLGARATCCVRRAVVAAAVGNNNTIDDIAWHLVDDGGD